MLREKVIYHVLNLFRADVSGMLRGEGWIVASAEVGCAHAYKSNARGNGPRRCLNALTGAIAVAGATNLLRCQRIYYAFQEFVDHMAFHATKKSTPHSHCGYIPRLSLA